MSFKLADLFVQVSVRGVKATQNSVGSLRAQLGSFTPLLGGLQLLSTAFLAAFTSAGLAATYAFEQAEQKVMGFQIALQNAGDRTIKSQEGFKKFAETLESESVLGRNAIYGLMTQALQLGSSIKDLETITKSGIGLGEMYFGGDAEQGVKALTLAQQGNFRQLQRLIPELKNAGSQQDALNIVMQKAREGLAFANERANTFGGALSRMRVSLENAGVALGEVFVPYLKQAAEFIQKVATYISNMDEVSKQLIIRISLIGAGIAALIVFGPPLLAFFGAVTTAVVGLVSTITSGFVFLLTNPIGWLITGIAAIAIAFAYVVGEGDKTVDRIANGFMQIVSFLDPMLGSFAGFALGLKMLWSVVMRYITDGVIGVKTFFLNAWEYIAEEVEQIWWSMFSALNEGWDSMKTGAQNAMSWLLNAWEQTTDTIANKLAYVMQRIEVTAAYRSKHPDADEDEVSKAVEKEMSIRKAYIDKQTSDAQQQHQKEHDNRMKNIDDEYNTNTTYMQKQIEDQQAADRAKRQNNRNANDDAGQKQIQQNKEDQDAAWAANKKKMDELPKLSTAIAELYKKIKSGLGVDEIEKQLNDLIAKFDKLKVTPGDVRNGGNGSLQSDSNAPLKTTSLQEAFKKSQANAEIGRDVATQQYEASKRAEVERKKQHDTTNKHLSALNGKFDNLGMLGGMV